MKTQLNFKTLLVTVLILACFTANSQNYETAKTVSQSASVPNDALLEVSNHSGALKITTSNKNSASIKTEVKVIAKTQEEADKLIKAIENFEFKLDDKTLKIDTRFYRTMQSTNSKTTLILKDGSKIQIKDFEIRHHLSIPASAKLNLTNKYGPVSMESINGDVTLDLYSCKLLASDFTGACKIKSKYSKLAIKNFNQAATLDLYDTDIRFISAGDIKINSKYSKVEGEKAGSLKLNSYDDNFEIKTFSALSLTAKYSDIKSEANLSDLKLDLYDCNLSIGDAKSMSFNGKYSDITVGNVKTAKIDDSYDNNITLGKTETIAFTKSKYSKYILDETSSFSIDDTYDDDVVIKKLNPDFSEISLNGKYTKLNATAGSVTFVIDVKMKYGKVDIPETIKITKHIEKSGNLEMKGGESGGTISVQGYDNTVLIK